MNKLLDLREKNKISKKKMAGLLKISEDEYSMYEKNPLCIPASKGRHISQIFGVTMSDIFLP